ncbi:MAG: PEP-CTERM sorting domain-containing protein [Acetobacteraceae bacterium]
MTGAALAAAVIVAAAPARATTTVLTFEGLGDEEPILNFYNGGFGGNGSGPGPSDGITFSANSLAIIEGNAGGSGNIQGEPSPVTVAFFLSGGADVMDVPAGFTTGFSFFYSAINNPGVINVWSGLDDTGTLLATLDLPVTPSGPFGSPPCAASGSFCPFLPIGVTFPGTAMSVDFGGTANQIAFDNITLGSGTPVGAPEPASLALLGVGLLGLGAVSRRKA